MKSTMKVAIFLAVVFCFVLVQPAISEPPDHARQTESIWKIFQDGTDQSVPWVDAVNPRFAIYDAGTPSNITDDAVLDKETGLIWERSPDTTTRDWFATLAHCYKREVANHRGWRLPTIEELTSLVDNDNSDPALPTDHPFSVELSVYFSSTTYTNLTGELEQAWQIVLWGDGGVGMEQKDRPNYGWCVRGGHGHDAY